MQRTLIVVGALAPAHSGVARFNSRLARALGGLARTRCVGVAIGNVSGDQADPEVDVLARLSVFSPRSWFRAAASLRAASPDLVVFNIWTPLLAPAYRVLLQAVPHGVPSLGLVHSFVPRTAATIQRWLFSRLTARFERVVALEGADRSLLPERAVWLPHPVEDRAPQLDAAAARRALHLDPHRRLALFFGFVREYKGLDLLLEAFLHLNREDVVLVVAGQHVHRYARLEHALALTQRLQQEQRVIVWDEAIPEAKMEMLFSAADVVVLPYRQPTSSGIGAQAVQHARPVVVTDFPALEQFASFHPASQVARRDDVRALTAALRRCLDAMEQAPAALRAVRAPSWDSFASRLLETVDLAVTE